MTLVLSAGLFNLTPSWCRPSPLTVQLDLVVRRRPSRPSSSAPSGPSPSSLDAFLGRFGALGTPVVVTPLRPLPSPPGDDPGRAGAALVGRVEWRPGDRLGRRDLGETLVRTGRVELAGGAEEERDGGERDPAWGRAWGVETKLEFLREDVAYAEKLAELQSEVDG